MIRIEGPRYVLKDMYCEWIRICLEWICIETLRIEGYVVQDTRTSSEEPCDETSFGKTLKD